MGEVDMTRILLVTARALVLSTAVAWAEYSDDSAQIRGNHR
jgi:hypothetical protein